MGTLPQNATPLRPPFLPSLPGSISPRHALRTGTCPRRPEPWWVSASTVCSRPWRRTAGAHSCGARPSGGRREKQRQRLEVRPQEPPHEAPPASTATSSHIQSPGLQSYPLLGIPPLPHPLHSACELPPHCPPEPPSQSHLGSWSSSFPNPSLWNPSTPSSPSCLLLTLLSSCFHPGLSSLPAQHSPLPQHPYPGHFSLQSQQPPPGSSAQSPLMGSRLPPPQHLPS